MLLFFGRLQRERTEKVCAMPVPSHRSSLVRHPYYRHILAVTGQAVQTAQGQPALIAESSNKEMIGSLLSEGYMGKVTLFSQFCIWITTALCVIRGIPVLWDGRGYLFGKYFPREIKDAG